MQAERRKRPRTAPIKYPAKLREALIDAARTGATEALEEFQKSRQAHFNGMTPDEHIKDHHFVKPRRELWEWLKLTASEGAGAGLKRIITLIVAAAGVTMILSFFGAVMSQQWRQWLITFLGG